MHHQSIILDAPCLCMQTVSGLYSCLTFLIDEPASCDFTTSSKSLVPLLQRINSGCVCNDRWVSLSCCVTSALCSRGWAIEWSIAVGCCPAKKRCLQLDVPVLLCDLNSLQAQAVMDFIFFFLFYPQCQCIGEALVLLACSVCAGGLKCQRRTDDAVAGFCRWAASLGRSEQGPVLRVHMHECLSEFHVCSVALLCIGPRARALHWTFQQHPHCTFRST